MEITDFQAADKLFTGDWHWIGGDGAYSVDLGDGRVLWLFGDSFVDLSGARDRQKAAMPRNTVALQTGYDPQKAKIVFFWREGKGGATEDFFPAPEKGEWYWPGNGVLLPSDGLLLFMMEIEKRAADQAALGFAVCGAAALHISNPDDAPPDWRMEKIALPQMPPSLALGTGGLCVEEGEIYAYGADAAHENMPVYLQRFDKGLRAKGALQHVFDGGQTEMSVHYDTARREFFCVQSIGFGHTQIGLRRAAAPDGAWSAAAPLFDPCKHHEAELFTYAAKAHPHLHASGGGTLVTYVTNSFSQPRLLRDHSIYYPKFCLLRRCA